MEAYLLWRENRVRGSRARVTKVKNGIARENKERAEEEKWKWKWKWRSRGKMEMEMEILETEINLSVKEEEEEEGLKIEDVSGKVHQLPCSIKYNGPSSVSHYFKPKPTPTPSTAIQHSFFRGRNLLGTTLPIPHPYSG